MTREFLATPYMIGIWFLFTRDSPFSPSRNPYEILLYSLFRHANITSRHNRGFFHLLVIGLTVLDWPSTRSQDDGYCRFLRWRHGSGYEEAVDMTHSFVGRSARGRKRTTAALSLKRALVNDNGRAEYVIPCARWDTLNWRYVFCSTIRLSAG